MINRTVNTHGGDVKGRNVLCGDVGHIKTRVVNHHICHNLSENDVTNAAPGADEFTAPLFSVFLKMPRSSEMVRQERESKLIKLLIISTNYWR